jgi:hypothetical protein
MKKTLMIGQRVVAVVKKNNNNDDVDALFELPKTTTIQPRQPQGSFEKEHAAQQRKQRKLEKSIEMKIEKAQPPQPVIPAVVESEGRKRVRQWEAEVVGKNFVLDTVTRERLVSFHDWMILKK